MKDISKLMRNQITKEQFLAINDIVDIDNEIEERLQRAYQNQYSNEVEELVYLIFVYERFEARYVSVLNKLLISDWHFQHENIVLILQKISSVESMEYLYNAIGLHLQYLEWDDNYAFEVKCIRAIYHIGKERSRSYLDKLCKHPNRVIREMSQRQIKKMV